MTDELRAHFLCLIEEAIERDEAHLVWLEQTPNEPDRDLQVSETTRSLQLIMRLRDVPWPSPVN
jgi:hypothetical protein